jgi:hypothetical protein
MRSRYFIILIASELIFSNVAAKAPSDVHDGWSLVASMELEAIGRGLPVLALGNPNWPQHLSERIANPRAFIGGKAELGATNANGWRFATLARAESWLKANADAVELAALDTTRSDPVKARQYNFFAQTQSWQGEGIKIGTPWMNLNSSGLWQWQTDVQLLRLKKLQLNEIFGNVTYQGSGNYNFDALSQRSNSRITDQFLGSSDTTGMGASLSFAVKGQISSAWKIELSADDLLSKLQWANLATDKSTLNSQVTSRVADGSLDYGPLIKGQKSVLPITAQIGTTWQTKVAWSMSESFGQAGSLTFRSLRKSEINQTWLGWDGELLSTSNSRWRIEIEPTINAAMLDMILGAFKISLATDFKGGDSQYSRVQFGWQSKF